MGKCFVKYWLPVLIWLGVIFVGSTDVLSAEHTSRIIAPLLRWLKPDITDTAIAQIQFFGRKTAHLTEYAVLSILLWRAVRGGTNLRMKMPILFVVIWIASVVFAASDEFHQSLVPSRTASPVDVVIDICGTSIGLAICWVLAGRSNRKLQIQN